MKAPGIVVFLVDMDDTLVDNDGIQDDMRAFLGREFGIVLRDRYWAIQGPLFAELGYRDYLVAVQRLRFEHLDEPRLLTLASFLLDYPFAERLYPRALDVLARLRAHGGGR